MFKKLSEIAEYIGGSLEGEDLSVNGVSGADDAQETFITFLESSRYRGIVASSRAAALIVPPDFGESEKPVIRVKNPRLAFAGLLELFYGKSRPEPSVHETALIGKNTVLGEGVYVGPYVVIGENVNIGNGTVIMPFVFLGDGVSVGENSLLHPRVTVMHGCSIGSGAVLHSGAVIGADGFGFVRDGLEQIKIPQVGTVEIGDDVEIGANTAIDRATTGKTVIGNGTKIDNLVQIGHNNRVGSHSTIVSQTGIAGSCKVGDVVTVGAQVGVKDHIEIGDGAIVASRSGVTKSVKPGAFLSGYPARDHREELRIEAAVASLPALIKRFEKLEKLLERRAELETL